MLEKLKAEVLLAYHELNRYGLDQYTKGTVSAIDRERGMIVVKSARDALVADMQGNVLEGTQASSSDLQSLLAIYRAFPKLGGVVQVGMDIPMLGSCHADCFQAEIPCTASVTEIGKTFQERSIDPLQTPAALVLSQSVYAWGRTALDAVTNAAALEKTANIAYHTMHLAPGIQPPQ